MAHAAEPGTGVCVVCNEALGAESHWITKYPDGEHARCRDWSEREWPFERELNRLRLRYRQTTALRGDIAQLGRWLEASRRKWPIEANEIARSAYAWIAAIDRKIDQLRKK